MCDYLLEMNIWLNLPSIRFHSYTIYSLLSKFQRFPGIPRLDSHS